MMDERVSYFFTGEEEIFDGTLWRQTDRVCGACGERVWVMDGTVLSGYCTNGHRCYLMDSWTT